MSGLPLKVPPWSPYSKQLTRPAATSAASGTPPPRPLPSVTMSGAIPACWQPRKRPVRPMPVWNLVGDEEDAALLRQRPQRAQVVVGGYEDTGFTLNRLEHHGDRAGGDGVGDGVEIA